MWAESKSNLDTLATVKERELSKLAELTMCSASSDQLKIQVDTILLLTEAVHKCKVLETEVREMDEDLKRKIQNNQISYIRKVLFLSLGITMTVAGVFVFAFIDQIIGVFITSLSCCFLGFPIDRIKTIFARGNIDE